MICKRKNNEQLELDGNSAEKSRNGTRMSLLE